MRPPNRATSLHPPLPSIRHSHPSAIPAPPPSFLRRQESMRPPNRATSLHPPFPSFRHSCAPSVIPAEAGIHATAQPCDEPPSAIPILPPFPSFRHSCAPSVIPAEAGIHATAQPCDEPPSAIPILPPFLRPLRHSCAPSSFLRPLRHSCAPSVIPAEAGIHATAQPCDEPPSAIPILPPFLRPLRHSCGGRNPCDRPTVRRASIRHSHPSAIPAPPPSFLRRQESMRPPNRATSLHPPDGPPEPPSARRPTRAPSAPRVIGRRRTLGVPLTPQIAWIPASAGMTDRRV